MTKIQVKPDNLVLEIAGHETILTASLRNDIPHLHACGGIGRCSTCQISITEGAANCLPPEKIELELAEKLDLPADIRLACQTKVTGDVSFRRLLLDDRDQSISNQLIENKEETDIKSLLTNNNDAAQDNQNAKQNTDFENSIIEKIKNN